ncbi:Myb-like protein [Gracilaria domingensis]|nr:Myb-like protein [Gracilaria domingensis]
MYDASLTPSHHLLGAGCGGANTSSAAAAALSAAAAAAAHRHAPPVQQSVSSAHTALPEEQLLSAASAPLGAACTVVMGAEGAANASSACTYGDRAGVRWSKEEDDLLLKLSKDVGVVKGKTMKQVAERMAQMGYRRSHRACQTRRLRLESYTIESRRNQPLQLSE